MLMATTLLFMQAYSWTLKILTLQSHKTSLIEKITIVNLPPNSDNEG